MVTKEQVDESLQDAEFARITLVDSATKQFVDEVIVSITEMEHLLRIGIVHPQSVSRSHESENVPSHVWAVGDWSMYDALIDKRWGISR